MKQQTPYGDNLISSRDALARRDLLEAALKLRCPAVFRIWISVTLTWLTGLAPSWTKGVPILKGSESRSFLLMAFALVAGTLEVLSATPFGVLAGGLALLYGMRSFSSVVGHHIMHGGQILKMSRPATRFIYDLISAAILVPRLESYTKDHQEHHAYTAGPQDADCRFVAYLGARFDGIFRFTATLLDPLFHWRFLRARLAAVFLQGPAWRRIFAGCFWAMIAASADPIGLVWLLLIAIVFYQTITLLQVCTEHLWGARPEGLNATEGGAAVTYGRLLLPDPTLPGFWIRIAFYGLFRCIVISGDLINHDLHHRGFGRWTESPYLRTRLMLEERSLRQTGDIVKMFRMAFDSAKTVTKSPLPPRDLDRGSLLKM